VAGGRGLGEDRLPVAVLDPHRQVVGGHAGLTVVGAPGHGDVAVVAPERRLDPHLWRGHVPHEVEGLSGGLNH